MKLTALATLVMSTLAVATTTTTPDPVQHFLTTANYTVVELFRLGCKYKPCLEVLAPTIASCSLALAQEEFDFVNDALCFASAAKEIHSKPAECKGCF
ncbi:uncharacterized protein M421DRAFT_274621 [Didymella exigua CBS 183.55]|uniref:Fungal calcium binding protein domain-containing protein n=1 Tax=Didymella exigua CBS 183.55 TaxID=1150837 RepID=A0A6A5R8Y6_9PLEO|nr:uncharacterized protein M421DRAFT_274621 [Didymella exigua CBS 183.55]KAF1924701.1 hypothetical protein M421DRAFT_274621 [Didymella exigua CBS 183.55]